MRLLQEARTFFDAREFGRALETFRRARDAFDAADDAVAAAGMCFWMGECLARQGSYAEAIVLAREMLARMRRLHGDVDHPDIATALNTLAFRLRSAGRPGDALGVYREALAMSLRVQPGNRARLTRYRNNVAVCLVLIGKPAEAIPVFQEVLAERRGRHTGDHEAVATSLNNLGNCLEQMGRPAQALPYYGEAYEMRRRLFPGDHDDVAASLNNLGMCLQKLGRIEEALEYHQWALEMLRRLHQRPNAAVAGSLNNVGFGLNASGQTAEALEYYLAALQMYDHLFDEHPRLASALNNVAGCLATLGRPEAALPLHRRALSMRQRLFGAEARVVARSLNNIAHCLEQIGKDEEAREHYEAAIDIARRTESPDTHLWTANLGWFQLRTLKSPATAAALFAESIAALEDRRNSARGLDLADRTAYFEHLRRADPFGGMVAALVRQGKAAEALRYVERGRARSLLDLLERSRFDPLREALRRARLRGDEASLRKLEETSSQLDDLERETVRLQHALMLARGRRDLLRSEVRSLLSALNEELRRAQGARRAALRRRAQLVRDHVHLAVPAEPEVIRRILQSRERMLVYSLARDEAFLFLVGPTGKEIRVFELEWSDGTPVTRPTVEAAALAYRDAVLREVGRAEERLEGDSEDPTASKHARDLFSGLVPAEAWAEIRGASRVYVVPHGALHLIPFEALVIRDAETAAKRHFWIDVGPPVAYAASGSTLLWCHRRREDQLDSPPLREAVALGDPVFGRPARDSTPELPAQGAAVLDVPLGTPAAEGGLNAGDVILSYDGSPTPDRKTLRRLVFAACSAMEDGARREKKVRVGIWRMGERRELIVEIAELGADIAAASPRDALSRLPFDGAVGRSIASTRSGLSARGARLQPLPGTRLEVESIRGALASATGSFGPWTVHLLLGEDATKTQLFTLAPRARYLHLATHQLTEEVEAGDCSRLALTMPRVPSVSDDGFLRLNDLLERWRDRLSGCEMVVLSACESRIGKSRPDEGVYSMPWGFMYAGAPCVVASLWLVDDASTPELMKDFFERLLTTTRTSKLDAFQGACRALRATHPEPYYWAPFVLIGDPR